MHKRFVFEIYIGEMTDPQPLRDGKELACHCHYPIGLVIFLIFTVLALLACICVCCIDITKCSFYQKRKQRPKLRRKSTFDPRFMTGDRIEQKFSLDPRLLSSIDSGRHSCSSVAPLTASTYLESTGSLGGKGGATYMNGNGFIINYALEDALVTTV